MAKKRNLPPESSQLGEPPLKQHQSEAQQENRPVQEDKENHQAIERSSTSPFGLTNSVFGQNNSTNNPFSPNPFGSTIVTMTLEQYLAIQTSQTFGPAFGSRGAPAFGATSTPAFVAPRIYDGVRSIPIEIATRIYDGVTSIPISISSCPTITEEDGGTSGQTAKLESISAMPPYNYERFESRFAVAGANYCLIAVDFTRDHTQILQLSGKAVMAGICGFQADLKALQVVLSALNLKYQGQHKMPMSCPEMHRLFCHFEKFHPILQDIILGGLDSEGKGCIFHHIGHGAFAPQVGYSSQNFGSRRTVSPILECMLPPQDVLDRLSKEEAFHLAKTVFESAFPHTGDKLEIVVLNASGIHRKWEDLRKDYGQVFSRKGKK